MRPILSLIGRIARDSSTKRERRLAREVNEREGDGDMLKTNRASSGSRPPEAQKCSVLPISYFFAPSGTNSMSILFDPALTSTSVCLGTRLA